MKSLFKFSFVRRRDLIALIVIGRSAMYAVYIGFVIDDVPKVPDSETDMAVDFSTYNNLRNVTRDAASIAATSAASEETALAAVENAEQALAVAQAAKAEAYAAWQKAERDENQEATRLGIDPIPVSPPVG